MEEENKHGTTYLAILAIVIIVIALMINNSESKYKGMNDSERQQVIDERKAIKDAEEKKNAGPSNIDLIKEYNTKQKANNGSRISEGIKHNSYKFECAKLLASHTPQIEVRQISRQSIFANNYLILYRMDGVKYEDGYANTAKCKVKNGTVRILSIFENF